MRTLVLNNQYMPISVFPLYTIDAKSALVRYLNAEDNLHNRTEVVYFYDRKVKTPSRDDLYWPSVIVNHTHKNPFKNEMRLRRDTLLLRDDFECFWCGTELNRGTVTYDHIIPRSKGGTHTFENVVCSCTRCNNQKGDKMPTGRWTPKMKPQQPTYFSLMEKAAKYPIQIPDARWLEFLPNFSESNVILKEEL